ncbi:capping complex subunit for YIEGIA [Tepidibacillus marianensis]|uniref:capping complex subunit for YIEGIA n=1 Tax=Tepidibacillus marianensis TaxID=3131995 RepID=UPI0030CF727D
MGKESSMKPNYEILAYITLDRNRIITGSSLVLFAENIDVQKEITLDIAKALKADIVQLKTGDYMVIRV